MGCGPTLPAPGHMRRAGEDVPLQLPAHSASRGNRNLVFVLTIDILKKNISHSKQQDQLMIMFKNLQKKIKHLFVFVLLVTIFLSIHWEVFPQSGLGSKKVGPQPDGSRLVFL